MEFLFIALGIVGILILTFLVAAFGVFAEAAIEVFAEKLKVKKQQKIERIRKEVEK